MVKLAAVKISRITCSDAVANRLPMVPLSNNTIKWASKNSQSIICNKLLLLRSEVESLFYN